MYPRVVVGEVRADYRCARSRSDRGRARNVPPKIADAPYWIGTSALHAEVRRRRSRLTRTLGLMTADVAAEPKARRWARVWASVLLVGLLAPSCRSTPSRATVTGQVSFVGPAAAELLFSQGPVPVLHVPVKSTPRGSSLGPALWTYRTTQLGPGIWTVRTLAGSTCTTGLRLSPGSSYQRADLICR
jgi:hypothetical protein